ncbi:MAG: SEC-C domain-containing protein [Firmicutes bacterium]|nr:SEC-C domain-containing protein [Bacillota bacterium]
MDQQLKDLCIKVEKGSNLDACLVKYTKPRLKAILDIFGEKMPASAKKQEMAEKAEEVIKANVITYFEGEGVDELTTMTDLCNNGLTIDSAEAFAPVQNLYDRGFAFVVAEGDAAEVFVPENVKFILDAGFETKSSIPAPSVDAEAPVVEADMNRTEEEAELLRYAKALANIYGVYPAKQLKEVWDYNHRRGIAPNDVIKAISKAGTTDGFYVGSGNIVSNLLPTVDEYFAVLDKHESTDIFFYATEDDINLYENGPVMDAAPEYFYLRSFLGRKTENEEAATELMKKLFLLCARDAGPNEVVAFMEKQNITFVDLEEFNKFVSLYTEWLYTLRIWACKGHKPAELRVERMVNRSFKLPSNVDPRKSKKIGRNDACPCGSGKKFKACCAKLI